MGGVCSAGTFAPNSEFRGKGFSGKLKSVRSFGEQKEDSYSSPDGDVFDEDAPPSYGSGELGLSISRELKPSTPARTGQNKVPPRSSFLGRPGIVGLERVVEVLDTLGSSMSNLNSNSGFISGMTSKGNKISILAFEIANTTAKGANLMQFFSQENVQFLKKEVLHSEGVQHLVSTDMNELLSIAAADKRQEFGVFTREVIRFGDLCKDPQWHHLDRLFSKLDSDHEIHEQQREEAEMTLQELTTLAQHTSELYHELNALERFEQDYQRKLEEMDSLHLPRKGEDVMMLQSELKHQRKIVRSLKKKSLWDKSLEEVVEKLVDIVTFINQAIWEVLGDNGSTLVGKGPTNKPERLGVTGLALHYASVIIQIDNIASRPTCVPPNMRDQLYHGLPNGVKIALRSRCQAVGAKEELTIAQIKAEMEKTLQWLIPAATNTTKAHQGFGWVGEWANTGNEFSKGAAQNNVIRLQTLYHADKQKTDMYILELAAWLHLLISVARQRDNGYRASQLRSPSHKVRPEMQSLGDSEKTCCSQLSPEDLNLLENVLSRKKLVSGLSKSQEFDLPNINNGRGTKSLALSRSTGNSPSRQFDRTELCVLDVVDGLDKKY